MTVEAVVEALAIPAGARVDRRIPKKTLLDEGASTAADRRLVQDGIDNLQWVAALKPGNIGVPAYRDAEREYLEIVVVTASFRGGARAARLTELIHRAIPYPLVLVSSGAGVEISLGHKRLSQGERGKVVLDGGVQAVRLGPARREVERAFLTSLPVSAWPALDLLALYRGWLDRIEALKAAHLTGHFGLPASPADAAERRAALDECARIEREAGLLRAQAASESQISRRVEINLALKRLEASLADQMARL